MMDISEVKTQLLQKDQIDQLEKYKRLNQFVKKGQILFTGSSLMEFFPVNELLQSLNLPYCIYNRGIRGYITAQMLEQIHVQILDLEPSKMFINIGTNDIGQGRMTELWVNYEKILSIVQEALPDCRIYIMAYYPCNDADDFGLSQEDYAKRFRNRTPATLLEANLRLRELCEKYHCTYVDANACLLDARGLMKREFCMDGVHMYPDAYVPVLQALRPYLEA